MSKEPKKRIQIHYETDTQIEELMNEFIMEKEADGRSKSTIESYRNSFKKFLQYFSNLKAKDISKDIIFHYKSYLQEEEHLSVSSINHYVRDLRTFMNWGYAFHDFPKLKISLLKGQDPIKEVYSPEELRKLLIKPVSKDSFAEWRTWVIINWILGTGNRIDTIINVRIKDIHFTQSLITIRAQKNKRTNNIPLDKNLSSILREYIKTYRREVDENDYLFCNIYGEQLTRNAYLFLLFCLFLSLDDTSITHSIF